MKILHVIDQISQKTGGGASKVAFELARAQAKLGHDVTIYTTDYNAKSQVAPRGVKLVKFRCWLNLFGSIRVAPGLLFAKYDFDIMHMHNYRTLVNLFAALRFNKIIMQAHGSCMPIRGLTKPLHDLVWGSVLLKRAKRCIADADIEVEHYITEGVNKANIPVIPVGINMGEFKRVPKRWQGKAKIVLFLGRYDKIKGIDLLVEAFKLLDRADTRLEISGIDYGCEAEIKAQVNKLGLDSKVDYLGPLYGQAKVDAYTWADVFVMPSRYEMWGITFMEALACFPSDTDIEAKDIIGTHKHLYTGDMITLTTTGGEIECTPEHPFWVGNRWALAKYLTTNHQLWYNKENTIRGNYAEERLQEIYSGTIGEVVCALQKDAPQRSSSGSGIKLRASTLAGAESRRTQNDWAEDRNEMPSVNRIGVGLFSRADRWRGEYFNQKGKWTRRQLEAYYQYFQLFPDINGLVKEEGQLCQYASRETSFKAWLWASLYILDNWNRIPSFIPGAIALFSNKEKTLPFVNSVVGRETESRRSRENRQEATRDYPDVEGFESQTITQIRKRKVKNLPVYNLTTKSHAYIAKGFLVHNCGTPVIMTDTCEASKMLPLECGMVVPFDAEHLATAINNSLNISLGVRYREYRRQWVSQYSWDNIAPQIIKLYKEVLSDKTIY